jgi:hypothetical protein
MNSFRQKVEATATYKSLNTVQKEFALSKANLKHLEDGLTIAINIGFEKWKNQSGYSERNSNLVYDLINQLPSEPDLKVENTSVDNVITFAQVQAIEIAKLNSFNEWRAFISVKSTESTILALNPSGNVVKELHLMNNDNYPLTVYETVLPAVKSVDYHSLSNN